MSWLLYRWVWELKAPLHIGMPPAGSLSRTRLYLPARAVWGAMTAELARLRQKHSFPDYDAVGQELRENTRFSYLYPAEKNKDGWLAWLPCYEDDKGLVWRQQRNEEQEHAKHINLASRLLTARVGTAIAPSTDTAEENTLRVMELINCYWRQDRNANNGEDNLQGRSGIDQQQCGQNNGKKEKKSVFLAGYFFIKEATRNLLNELEQINTVFLGGDTRYGLGKAVRVKEEMKEVKNFFDEKEILLQEAQPVVKTNHLLAHTYTDDLNDVIGALEYLGGWETKGGTGSFRDFGLTWVPGSTIVEKQNASDASSFLIDEKGLWKKQG